MKCWKLSQTKKYIQSGNDGDDELKFHIEICPECQTLVREAEEEEKLWMDLLYSESLPEGFTERVMSALEGVEIEQTEPIHSAAASKRIRKTRRLLKKKRLMDRIVVHCYRSLYTIRPAVYCRLGKIHFFE